jgi:hypothetical protein
MMHWRTWAAAALAGVALSTASGCIHMAAGMAEVMVPKEKQPAEFKVPPDKTMLVFPDDRLNPIAYSPIKRALAERINATFAEEKVAANIISYDKLLDLRDTDRDFNSLSVSTVGKKLGADYVLYISLEEFKLKDSPADTLWHGRFGGKIRVVDVAKRARVWPEQTDRQMVVGVPGSDNAGPNYDEELSHTLAAKLGDEISGLFYEHWVERNRPPPPEPESEQ